MEVKLVVVGGDAKPTEIKLKLPAIIGRGRSASLTLPHPLVSRQHCELYESGGKLFVRDMGSLNGTFVGEEKIDEAALESGALLTVGNVTFRPIYGDQSQNSSPAPIQVAAGGNADAATEPMDFEFVDDDEIEEISEEDFAIEEVDEVEEVAEVEEVDPLEPPGANLAQTVRIPEPTKQDTPQKNSDSAKKATEKAPAANDKAKKAAGDDQFLQFLDDEEDDSPGSDDDDLNAFLKDFK